MHFRNKKKFGFSIALLGLVPVLAQPAYNPSHGVTLAQKKRATADVDLLTKAASGTITRLSDQSHVGYTIGDVQNQKTHRISVSNDDLVYQPGNLNSIKAQTVNAIRAINEMKAKAFVDRISAMAEDLNQYVMVTGFKPILERAYVNSFENGDYAWELAPNVQYKYEASSVYSVAPAWTDYFDDPGATLTQKVGYTYYKFSVRGRDTFPINQGIEVEAPVASNVESMFVPEAIYERDGVISFKVGSAGRDIKRQNDSYDYSYGSFLYRAGFMVYAKRIPRLYVDTASGYQIANPTFKLPLTAFSDPLRSFVSLKDKNVHNPVKQHNEFLSYRDGLSNQAQTLRAQQENSMYIEEHLGDGSGAADKQIQVQSKTVSAAYGIVQYRYLVPETLRNAQATYKISNDTLSAVRQYQGAIDLLADYFLIDETSGVKAKGKDGKGVYTKEDYERLGLRFRFDPEFLAVLNEIDANNAAYVAAKRVGGPKADAAAKAIWNFECDLSGYDGDAAGFVASLDESRTERQPIVDRIKAVLGASSEPADADVLGFWHDLPQLFSDFYAQMSVEASIVQAGQLPFKTDLFADKTFNGLNFDDALLAKNRNDVSKNLASLDVSNIAIRNRKFTFEDRLSINLQRVARKFGNSTSLVAKPNSIKYEVYYRSDFANVAPANGLGTTFEVDRETDRTGVMASEYADNEKNELIRQTVNKSFSGARQIEFDDASMRVLGEGENVSGALKRVIDEYRINPAPNNQTGAFYALATIKNSHDLANFGNQTDNEIIPNAMWFVQQESDPTWRTYLIKLVAAKKILSWDQLGFEPASERDIALKIGDQRYFAGLQTDHAGNLLPNQAVDLGFLAYWGLPNDQMPQSCFFGLELALAELGHKTFYSGLSVNAHLKQMRFQATNKPVSAVAKADGSNAFALEFGADGRNEIKYRAEYGVAENGGEWTVSLAGNREVTQAWFETYVAPHLGTLQADLALLLSESEPLAENGLRAEATEIGFADGKLTCRLRAVAKRTDGAIAVATGDVGLFAGIAVAAVVVLIVVAIAVRARMGKKKKSKDR